MVGQHTHSASLVLVVYFSIPWTPFNSVSLHLSRFRHPGLAFGTTHRDPPILQAHNRTDIILRLPMGKRIKDIRWLSVWCRRFTVSPRSFFPSIVSLFFSFLFFFSRFFAFLCGWHAPSSQICVCVCVCVYLAGQEPFL